MSDLTYNGVTITTEKVSKYFRLLCNCNYHSLTMLTKEDFIKSINVDLSKDEIDKAYSVLTSLLSERVLRVLRGNKGKDIAQVSIFGYMYDAIVLSFEGKAEGVGLISQSSVTLGRVVGKGSVTTGACDINWLVNVLLGRKPEGGTDVKGKVDEDSRGDEEAKDADKSEQMLREILLVESENQSFYKAFKWLIAHQGRLCMDSYTMRVFNNIIDPTNLGVDSGKYGLDLRSIESSNVKEFFKSGTFALTCMYTGYARRVHSLDDLPTSGKRSYEKGMGISGFGILFKRNLMRYLKDIQIESGKPWVLANLVASYVLECSVEDLIEDLGADPRQVSLKTCFQYVLGICGLDLDYIERGGFRSNEV